ncbi:hypothetical protein BIV23_32750 [Streptomyces monashensis]|uniref:Molybdopterin oxidoreductase domain-containing protein n=1 Tax=Streptomyces monashensis TaxID=1678012 RepID=A0A1S2PRE7_9ACTN|nr:hypothetical protein BIV23_32750 [Streptomyces monashensis]
MRGVLLELYREARARLGDPVAAWAEVTSDPVKRRRHQSARGKGGLARVSWQEALEIAAAHVHTIAAHGPDRVAGFSPIPAMSMASHAVGARFMSLIGAPMPSFHDWYADLPVASPQVFGDQTDVPESGDWWDAAYLMLWGSNVPVTHTPDAHWMTEARYRGQKVVVVSPDHGDAAKFADEWLHPHPGADGALAMAMGHVILTEFFVRRQVPYFTDCMRRFTDLPFLVGLEERDGRWVPGKFVTAATLGLGEEDGNLLLAQYGVGRPDLPGAWATDYADAGRTYTHAWQEAITSVPAAAVERAREFADTAVRTRGRCMIVTGAGTNHWFHSDTVYRAFLTLLLLTGCQGVNGGGWAHYVGQEKVRPYTGWQQLQSAAVRVRPSRQTSGTPHWYLHTDQWRYDPHGADALAAPTGKGLFAGRHTADLVAQSMRLGWMPAAPAFRANPLDLGRAVRDSGHDPDEWAAAQLADGGWSSRARIRTIPPTGPGC